MTNEWSKPEPDIEIKPVMRIVGYGRVFQWSEMGEIPHLWQKAGPWIETVPNAVNENAYGAMFIPEPGSGDFGYLAGIAVSDSYLASAEQMVLTLPETRFAIFPHDGGLADWPSTIDYAQNTWLPQSGYERIELAPGAVPVLERYGPGFDPGAGLGDMQCWLAIK
jgi:AraC family transcriptional regulator